MVKEPLFRITFLNQDELYEMYARSIGESDMFGFIEVEEFVFGENTSIVVDPSEERLKHEFAEVKRSYIPMHSVIRIDEVTQRGVAKIRDSKASGNVSHFPKHANILGKKSDD